MSVSLNERTKERDGKRERETGKKERKILTKKRNREKILNNFVV